MNHRRLRLLTILGPGILVAATGVGAGDLATGAIVGSELGIAVLWAVVIGAGLKYVLSEGLTRWQLATETTLLEGCVTHFGRVVQWLMLAYLVLWSFFVGAALMSACGVAMHAIRPLISPEWDKIIYGLLHSAVAVVLVSLGGYRLFGRVMAVCIAIMFLVVVTTAVAIGPDWSQIGWGLVRPTIPDLDGRGIPLTIALMGGVGGTLTILCYGYWIREEGRHGAEALRVCRIDLAAGYAMTAVFGVAMVIIGSHVQADGKGATLVVELADELARLLGPAAKWAFLIGAWGAFFSSLLGVWQSVPYLFADFWGMMQGNRQAKSAERVDTRSRAYRGYLFALATVPAVGLLWSFDYVQITYAIVGALCIPILAVALLILGGQARLVGRAHRNRWWTTLLLLGTVAFFIAAGCLQVASKLD